MKMLILFALFSLNLSLLAPQEDITDAFCETLGVEDCTFMVTEDTWQSANTTTTTIKITANDAYAGSISWSPRKLQTGDMAQKIVYLNIHPSCRRIGYGSALLQYVLACAAHNNYQQTELEAIPLDSTTLDYPSLKHFYNYNGGKALQEEKRRGVPVAGSFIFYSKKAQ